MSDFLEKNKPIIFPSLLFLAAAVLECPSLIRSGYFSVIGTEYLVSFVLFYAFILLMWLFTQSESGVYLTTSASVLMLGNWSQPLLNFGCDMDDEAADVVHRIELFSTFVIVSVIAVWCVLSFLEILHHRQLIETIISSAVCMGLCGIIFLFSDKNSNTSTISNIQPAIFICFLILYCFAGFLNIKDNNIKRFIHLICFGAMMMILIYKHEGGIPLICYISCLIMYMFLYPISKIRFLLFYIITPIALLTILLTLDHGLLTDTIGKFNSRFSENDQSYQAIQNLKFSGLFGSFSYDYYLPAASTDFSLNTSIHYWGFLWGVIFVLIFIKGALQKAYELSSPHGFDLSVNLTSLSFTAFCIIIGYNLLVSLGIVPIVGVQALFCGKSLSIAILSGLLLGGITYDKGMIKKNVTKIFSCYNQSKLYIDN